MSNSEYKAHLNSELERLAWNETMKTNLLTKLEKLEAIACENQDATGERIETPTAYMFVPFGTEISAERLEKLEAAERIRQDKPTGFIFVPYEEETAQ